VTDYSRQSFLGPDSEAVLGSIHVGIIGLGGGGSHVAQQLAHLGVGRITLIDPDTIEDSNLNRLVGGTAQDVDCAVPKTEIARRLISSVRPACDVRSLLGEWQNHVPEIREVHAIFGAVDSLSQRVMLEQVCRRFLIPYIDVGMDVLDLDGWFNILGQVVLSTPGNPCLRCMGLINDADLAREERARQYGAAGGKPQVIWPNGTLASTAVGLFVQLVTPWHPRPEPVAHLEYDGNANVLVPAPRLAAMRERGLECMHYRDCDVGDPFYRPAAEIP
jgi:molybdopterin-synthase adenylyltransferase